MKNITLICPIRVEPAVLVDPATGKEIDGKTLVFENVECGEIVRYTLGPDLNEEVWRKMKMSNVALQAKIQEEYRRAEARARLQGGNGGREMAPGEQAAVKNLLDGIHTKDEGTKG